MADTTTYFNHEPTYHKDKNAAYVLPNDAPEHVRLEEQARHLSAIMNDQIIHAPFSTKVSNARMLDVGCGTGIVTDYLGTRFPDARVYGLDLSPVPSLPSRPSNVQFLQRNILSDEPSQWQPTSVERKDNIFDLIFSRLLVCGLSDWPGYVRKAHQLLKPGGYLEIHDIDWIWYDHKGERISDDWKWLRACREVGNAQGMDIENCASKAKPRMQEAGFEVVSVNEYKWPVGGKWEKDLKYSEFGDYVARYMPAMKWHMIARLLDGKCSKEEIREMQEEMVRNHEDMQKEDVRGYWVFKVTVGRKVG